MPVHLGLGGLLKQYGLVTIATSAYRDAVAADPRSFEAQLALGEALARSGRWEAAVEALRAASALRPADVDAQGLLVFVLSRAGRMRDAAAAMKRLVDLRPGERDLHLALGMLQCRIGRPWEAIRTFRWAARLDAPPRSRRFVLGEAVFGEELWQDRVGQLDKAHALVIGPMAPALHRPRRAAARATRQGASRGGSSRR